MSEKKNTGAARASRATKLKIEQRVQALVTLMRGGGGGPAAICQYVAEREQASAEPWKLGPGCKPLSERTIERYAALATRRIREEIRREEKEILREYSVKKKKQREIDRVNFARMRAPFQSGGMPQ